MAGKAGEAKSKSRTSKAKTGPKGAEAGNGGGGRAKNIVLCSDGTGNSGGKERGTNVWAVFNAVWRHPDANGELPDRTQVTFYDDGVGTQNFFAFKLLGGAFGWGYSRNIRDLYRALVSAYEPGDSVYLFGFSRGAYTVRCLAGLILAKGILNRHAFTSSKDLDYAVWAVFRAYRDGYKSCAAKLRRWLRPGYAKAYAGYRTGKEIHHFVPPKPPDTAPRFFIGVWDTVDAVGLPFDGLSDALDWVVRFRFPDQILHENVEKACHAIAIDDERRTFWPVMWNEGDEPNAARIEQVWFPGVHSNVGGGYPKDQMAMVSLDWMMAKAEKEGLLFYKDVRAGVREAANAHGKQYDSRAGLAAYYRYKPRVIKQICDSAKPRVKIDKPKIHMSALRRAARATAGYAPAGIPEDIAVVGTHDEDDRLIKRLADAFNPTAELRTGGLRKVARYVRARRILYHLFLLYSLGLLGAAAWFYWFAQQPVEPTGAQPPWLVGFLFDAIRWVVPDFLFGFLRPLLEQARAHWVIALIVIAVLPGLVILKSIFESKSSRHARDAWRAFRECVYPQRGAPPQT